MTWVGGLLSDEATFPTKAGRSFPSDNKLSLLESAFPSLKRFCSLSQLENFPQLSL